ncbi:ABC-2 family transporter protein [Bartonella sp. DGB1]|uniref:ABC-2 family transporter protein n=1 Tax=Bartonella sp. DGB1 TaxID=3239807 RepID=UPI0035247903
MRISFYYILLNIKRQCAYKKNLLGTFILSMSCYLIQFIYIDQVSSYVEKLGSYSKDEIHLIFVIFILLSLFLSIFTTSIEMFFEKVAQGKIEPYLTKPVPSLLLMLFGWCKPLNLINFCILALFAYYYIELPPLSGNYVNYLEFIIALICILIINICFFLLLNFLTFITSRKMPVAYLHATIYELSFLPITIYPTEIIKWLLFLLPMIFSASLPASFLLNKNEWSIEILIASTSIIFFLTNITYQKSISKFNSFGG